MDHEHQDGQSPPNAYRLYREIGEISAKLNIVLENQKDFKEHMTAKFKDQKEVNDATDVRFASLESYKGMMVGVCACVSLVLTLVVSWFKDRFH